MMPNLDFFDAARLDMRLPKTTQLYELVRGAIIAMVLPPGEAILEREICARLGVSRTPLREAVLQLATERLVVVRPGGGTFVNAIDLGEVLAGQLVRDTLEVRLTRLAARRFAPEQAKDFELSLYRQKEAARRRDVSEFFELDNGFHRLVCTVSGISGSWRTLHAATGQLDRVRRLAFPIEDNYETVLAEHAAIYEGVRRHDEAAAVAALQEQLDSIFVTIRLIREQRPELLSGGEVGLADIR
ncbi:GntR family transcriptional regulator [Labrys wisconsinensis]|uniref:DNA-binding GntR family transcriptional regulator n=1 Tax=Labrys wisconsinensis TaxID=425677 RepID=A0ABU0JL16_9HYPH|nr:GntR family transcriptional regulator [Labrys wisconsinensis]MDQ0474058.1 DNA-binding GntR family transcriptional regulator [Labrys wisconsinensis]